MEICCSVRSARLAAERHGLRHSRAVSDRLPDHLHENAKRLLRRPVEGNFRGAQIPSIWHSLSRRCKPALGLLQLSQLPGHKEGGVPKRERQRRGCASATVAWAWPPFTRLGWQDNMSGHHEHGSDRPVSARCRKLRIVVSCMLPIFEQPSRWAMVVQGSGRASSERTPPSAGIWGRGGEVIGWVCSRLLRFA